MSRILGIDFGERRIGLAVSDELLLLAHPLKTLVVSELAHTIEEIKKIAEERGASELVVGLPVNMDGTRGEAVERVEEFVRLLSRKIALPVHTWDERLSTVQVEKTVRPLKKKKERKHLDPASACIILQSFLDHRHRTGTPSE